MTDTPYAASDDSPGAPKAKPGSAEFAATPGQHESAHPAPQPSSTSGRHGLAGGAGYPQFEGPGAAQYGDEPVEPAPPVASPGYSAPRYGPSGTGPGYTPGHSDPAPGDYPDPARGVSGEGASTGGQTPGYYHSGAHALDVGQALNYGFDRFKSNPGPWLGVTGVGVLIYLAFTAYVQLFEPTSMFTLLFLFLIVMVGLWLLQAAMVRGALYETDGYPPAFGSFFRFVNAGNVLLTALLAFGLTLVGSTLCLLPGLVVGFFCMYSIPFVIDQDYGPFDALKASAQLVLANLWASVLLALAVTLITLIGLALCGLGLFVAAPVCTIAVTYAYRMLTQGPVARV
ncbi:hypothetical protein [Nocardia camponoti]|uniref:Integral membrane protein n=1 Tax=Nocardia camponoti TaxID=1616106 RepID=A0A917V5I4_9NOCA|nr:hypothetical protein [Nocardia camponoti]GGK39590.1 hypothetical protein GCM10011591_09120 [Nocardia camponoti]